ncbi:Asp23/Gls24 family envelope stress response protein [Rhabdothermincola salaria]|uniref:Asp23/Gls24 family envelope stress response protein n=1 Tax=Rhabdothermincola salaria TaxID=2903142 RepID=UPI001E30B202|nr:Asp23/Gls24 family envelope stress response protein [Rhabdothermincola salaria]MCD9623955.1 Asp23/Gls24 family envelope stress response protein [Rhabdothermincola salaria]
MSPDAGSPAPSTLELARVVADASRSHDDVVDLDAGPAGEFATYGLGERITGVRVDTTHTDHPAVQVRLVVRFGRPVTAIGAEVHARVVSALRDRGGVDDPAVHVHVADLVEGDRTDDDTQTLGSAAADDDTQTLGSAAADDDTQTLGSAAADDDTHTGEETDDVASPRGEASFATPATDEPSEPRVPETR